jgi:hypothetical protein
VYSCCHKQQGSALSGVGTAEPLRPDEEVEAAWEEGLALLNHRKPDKQVRSRQLYSLPQARPHHSRLSERQPEQQSNAACQRAFLWVTAVDYITTGDSLPGGGHQEPGWGALGDDGGPGVACHGSPLRAGRQQPRRHAVSPLACGAPANRSYPCRAGFTSHRHLVRAQHVLVASDASIPSVATLQ